MRLEPPFVGTTAERQTAATGHENGHCSRDYRSARYQVSHVENRRVGQKPPERDKKDGGFTPAKRLAKRRSLGLLGGDPVVDALIKNAQRQGAVPQDFVVKGTDVKLVSELGRGPSAEIF